MRIERRLRRRRLSVIEQGAGEPGGAVPECMPHCPQLQLNQQCVRGSQVAFFYLFFSVVTLKAWEKKKIYPTRSGAGYCREGSYCPIYHRRPSLEHRLHPHVPAVLAGEPV